MEPNRITTLPTTVSETRVIMCRTNTSVRGWPIYLEQKKITFEEKKKNPTDVSLMIKRKLKPTRVTNSQLTLPSVLKIDLSNITQLIHQGSISLMERFCMMKLMKDSQRSTFIMETNTIIICKHTFSTLSKLYDRICGRKIHQEIGRKQLIKNIVNNENHKFTGMQRQKTNQINLPPVQCTFSKTSQLQRRY